MHCQNVFHPSFLPSMNEAIVHVEQFERQAQLLRAAEQELTFLRASAAGRSEVRIVGFFQTFKIWIWRNCSYLTLILEILNLNFCRAILETDPSFNKWFVVFLDSMALLSSSFWFMEVFFSPVAQRVAEHLSVARVALRSPGWGNQWASLYYGHSGLWSSRNNIHCLGNSFTQVLEFQEEELRNLRSAVQEKELYVIKIQKHLCTSTSNLNLLW